MSLKMIPFGNSNENLVNIVCKNVVIYREKKICIRGQYYRCDGPVLWRIKDIRKEERDGVWRE